MTLSSGWFWPDVSDRKNALAAIDESFWVTMLLAALAAVSTFIDLPVIGRRMTGCGVSRVPHFLSALALASGRNHASPPSPDSPGWLPAIPEASSS
jgi:hypothetical protein